MCYCADIWLPWTAAVFDILHILCGQFTSVIEINLFIQVKIDFYLLWAILPLIKPLFSKSMHLLSQIVTFNQSIRIIRHLSCYQTNETSINKMNLCRSCIWSGIYTLCLDVFTHCLMQLRWTWSALTWSYKCIMFWYFKHKH